MNTPGSKNSDEVETLVTWLAALSMALAAGVIGSIHQVNPTMQFQFSAVAVAAFIVTGALTFWFFRMMLRGRSSRRRKLFVLTIAALFTLPVFVLYALRSVASERRMDFAIGGGIAI